MNTVMRSLGGSVGGQIGASVIAGTVVGTALPTEHGFELAFILAAVACFLGALASMAVPRPGQHVRSQQSADRSSWWPSAMTGRAASCCW